MAASNALGIFFTVLTERCRSLKNELEIISASDFPSTAPQILAKCLTGCLDSLLVRTEFLQASSLKDHPTIPIDELGVEASNISAFVSLTSDMLCPMLRNSTVTSVPSELVLPMERIARLVFPDSQVIVESVPELNYYFIDLAPRIWSIFSSVDLENILVRNSFPKQIFHLRLCSNPPCGILTHCILGHEIGHAIYLSKRIDQILLPLVKIDDKDIKSLIDTSLRQSERAEGSAAQLPLEQGRDFFEYALKTQIMSIVAKWVKELFCDMIGVGFFGPAFICAEAVVLLPFQDIDSPKMDHPASRYRMQVALRGLMRSDPGFGFRKIPLEESTVLLMPMVKPWMEFVGVDPITPTNPNYKIALDSIHRISQTIIEQAKIAIGSASLSVARFRKEIPLLRSRIIEFLPPNEYQEKPGGPFKYTGLQIILNAGWLSYLCDMPDLQGLLGDSTLHTAQLRFLNLISKAVESSDMQERWNKALKEHVEWL